MMMQQRIRCYGLMMKCNQLKNGRNIVGVDNMKQLTQNSQLRQYNYNAGEKSVSQPFNSLLKVLGYYGTESTNIRAGQALFRSCDMQGMLVSQHKPFGIICNWDDPTSFSARQQLLLLHIWMVHRRLLQDGDRGKDVQEVLFDTLWENTTKRIRGAGIQELAVNKHLSIVQKMSFGAAVSYDHGYNCKNDNNLELGSALFRNIFHNDPKTSDECVLSMAKYVREQVDILNELESGLLYEGKLKWIDFADVDSASVLGEWRPAIASSGRTYWWNVNTRESRWEKPSVASV